MGELVGFEVKEFADGEAIFGEEVAEFFDDREEGGMCEAFGPRAVFFEGPKAGEPGGRALPPAAVVSEDDDFFVGVEGVDGGELLFGGGGVVGEKDEGDASALLEKPVAELGAESAVGVVEYGELFHDQ